MTSTFQSRWAKALTKPVPGYSVAFFRIVMGALMLFESVNYGVFHCLDCIYRETELLFKYPYFGWAQLPPGNGLEHLLFVMGVASIGVILGLWYRVCVIVVTLCFAWFFLLDSALYLNHYYLTLLFLGIMCFIPANRVWALDAKRYAKTSPFIGNWSRLWLIIQLEIVLIYAGVVKLNLDWLQLEPLRLWMTSKSASAGPLMQWLTQDAGIALAAYGVIALHIIGAPLLLLKKTRFLVFCLYLIFHSINAAVFNIGIFPFMTAAATTMLFAPTWPLDVLAKLRGTAANINLVKVADSDVCDEMAHGLKAGLIILFMSMWLLVQIVLPTRPLWYEGRVAWNEAGHYLSWRMKLRDKRGDTKFFVRNSQANNLQFVDPADHLTRRQARKMACKPDLIWQFAQHLEQQAIEQGKGLYTAEHISVVGHANCSLNTRKPQALLQQVDLTSIGRNAPAREWITELTTEFPSR